MSDRASDIRGRVNIIEVIGDVVPLKRKGTTFFGNCPFHEDRSPSFAVDEGKQLYHCHGCGAGGDVIRFVERYYKLEFTAALEFLGGERAARQVAVAGKRPKVPVPEWVPGMPPREAFPDEIGLNNSHVWAYRTPEGRPWFYIRRRDTREGKQIFPLAWGALDGKDGYYARHVPIPRPLYNLHTLTRMNDREVIMVEGEKAADAAARLFPGCVATTWPGGTNAVGRVDWSPLAGRRVALWPDADEPGIKAMDEVAAALLELGCTVRLAKVGDKPKGWDAADALAEGWDNGRAGAWLGEVAETIDPLPSFEPMPDDEPLPEDEPGAWLEKVPPQGEVIPAMPEKNLVNGEREYPAWAAGLPSLTLKGHPVGNEANALYICERDPALSGRIQFDEFTRYLRVIGPLPWASDLPLPRNWIDSDDANLAIHMQKIGIPVKVSQAATAARVAGERNRIHPVRSYLHSLEWDGEPRLEKLLTDYVRDDDEWTPELERYRQAVGRKWMMQAVARIMRPGCQADMTLVIEGLQGGRKSSLFRALAGDWFTDDVPALGTKDATDHVTTSWICELPELSAIRKSDIETVKAFLTRRVDKYRPPYGRTTIEVPRQAVFCATTNDSEWLEDRTGNRRFYPVKATSSDIAAVLRDRDQLWAEAVSYFESGENWYIDNAELLALAKEEQASRVAVDPWATLLTEMMFQKRLYMHDCLNAVGMPGKDRATAHTKRITRILMDAGYSRKKSGSARFYERL